MNKVVSRHSLLHATKRVLIDDFFRISRNKWRKWGMYRHGEIGWKWETEIANHSREKCILSLLLSVDGVESNWIFSRNERDAVWSHCFISVGLGSVVVVVVLHSIVDKWVTWYTKGEQNNVCTQTTTTGLDTLGRKVVEIRRIIFSLYHAVVPLDYLLSLDSIEFQDLPIHPFHPPCFANLENRICHSFILSRTMNRSEFWTCMEVSFM